MTSALQGEEKKSKECIWAGEGRPLPLFTAAILGTKLLAIVSCGIFKLFSNFIKKLFIELHLNLYLCSLSPFKSSIQDTCICHSIDGLFWKRLICTLSPCLVYRSVYVVFAVFFTNSLLLLWLPSQWVLELNLPELLAAMIPLWCSDNHNLEKIF